jgi:spore germination protein KB
VPVIPLVVLIISLSLITVHDFTAFLPILENGITPVLNAAFSFITFPFGETVAFLMLFPHLNKKEKLKKVVFVSAAVSILLGIILFFRDIFVLGSDLMARSTCIPHLTSLLIPGLNVEPLVDINLLIGGGVKISVCIYAAARALSQIAGISDYRKLTGAISTFCVVLSIWAYENVLEMFNWAEKVWPYYSIPFQIVVPLLLLLLSLRKKASTRIQG